MRIWRKASSLWTCGASWRAWSRAHSARGPAQVTRQAPSDACLCARLQLQHPQPPHDDRADPSDDGSHLPGAPTSRTPRMKKLPPASLQEAASVSSAALGRRARPRRRGVEGLTTRRNRGRAPCRGRSRSLGRRRGRCRQASPVRGRRWPPRAHARCQRRACHECS